MLSSARAGGERFKELPLVLCGRVLAFETVELPEEEDRPALHDEPCPLVLPRKELGRRDTEEHFVAQTRAEGRRPRAPFVPRNLGAREGAGEERDFPLRESRALAVRTQICWSWNLRHGSAQAYSRRHYRKMNRNVPDAASLERRNRPAMSGGRLRLSVDVGYGGDYLRACPDGHPMQHPVDQAACPYPDLRPRCPPYLSERGRSALPDS